jgi:hypothetical protein
MSTPPPGKYLRDVAINEPGMVGARWWNRSLIEYDKSVSRRKVLKTIAVAGGVALFVGLAVKGISNAASDADDDNEAAQLQLKKSLEMQQKYGWDFGARGQALVFDGVTVSPFDRKKLAGLGAVMMPLDAAHRSFHRQTLTESLAAQPAANLPADPDTPAISPQAFVPLSEIIVPAESGSMRTAYAAGEALARLAANRETVDGNRVGLLIDLQGPETVAFAAGAADVFEPVMLFDNWPHPRGVVAAHNTLAALAFYQPRFEAARAASRKWPAFMLDRARFSTYSDASDRFDNRYYARFPTAEALRARDITQILYVVSGPASLPEPTDLNGPLSSLALDAKSPAIGARAIAASDFGWSTSAPLPPAPGPSASPSSEPPPGPPAAPAKNTYYGGKPESDGSIWTLYPVFKYTAPPGTIGTENQATRYRFLKQASATQTEPPGFGVVGVMVGVGSGVIIAAALDRAGSMNRFSGGWSG